MLTNVLYTVFISIDCGASSSYTDGNSIKWDKDDPYIKSGENRNVETLGYNKSNDFGQISRVLDTVRVFPKNKKNCYSIKVAEGDRVLVRATFAYGNYDSKSSPPNFDLSINGNYWGNVVSNADWFYYEAIYTVKGDTVSVCLAQTDPNQFPFISGLEVRSLDKSMYKDVGPDYPLFASTRISYGLNEPVRFPDDTYDRIWSTAILAEGVNKVQSDTSSVDIDIEDNPPKSVLQSGIETADLLTNLILGNNLPKEKNPIYINTYFSEVSMKNSLLKRSFVMYIDDKPTTTKPIIPPYKSVLEMTTTDITASSSTVITMKSTTDSTLPPLINAMEIFIIGDKLTDGTNTKDVKALALLQKSFDQLQEWSGDPCLPSPVTWDWIECNSDAMPRITALYLNGLGLSGKIPDFSDMDALQNIDLHNNSFTEEVPDFLGSFRKLTELRSSFGANKTIRFPDDAYDRIWIPGTLGVGLTEVQSDTSLITVDVEDHPPKSVLQSGIVAANLSNYIVLGNVLPKEEFPIYMNTYFSEVSKLKSSQKRSFGIYINDNVTTNTPIIPPYKSVLEIVTTGVNASALTEFAIKSMNDSTLPPLINALEVFIVGNKLTDGTNLNDGTFSSLRDSYFKDFRACGSFNFITKEFRSATRMDGDPCLPSPYTWDWVDCNSDAMPRIIGLYLNGLGLSGTIPDFSNMDALQNIDLHNNNFTEKVPDSLVSFPNLQNWWMGLKVFGQELASTQAELEYASQGEAFGGTSKVKC
ncbi:hypothetical protein GIB67_009094 [Kingdonia uniflora]|uniref:Malectin-like domain-containing protein n=1 Tax=Kingdonia uniflora TaxID=39325 RepID=A0A7J7LBB0_9MAGN|nr:hypothetical protein GIB67_009094 [Kingdonia uniflora]